MMAGKKPIAFLLFEDMLDLIEGMDSESKREKMALALFRYEIRGVIPDYKGDRLSFFYALANSVDRTKERYEASVESGKKGGRPNSYVSEEAAMAKYEELHNWAKVAETFGITDETLRKFRKSWNSKKPKKPKNPNKNKSKSMNNTLYSIGNADEPHSKEKEEELFASQGEPEKYSETTEPPAGTAWDGEPYRIGDEWVRDFRRPGTAEMGTVRITV